MVDVRDARAEPPSTVLRRSAASPAAVVPPGGTAVPTADGRWRVRLTLPAAAAAGAARAQLAGDFTGWLGQALPMQPDGTGGFTVEALIPEGRRTYKFVLDGARWIADPSNPLRVDDHNGGANSVLLLGPDVALDPSGAQLGDGRIAADAVIHRPRSAQDVQPMPDGRVAIRLRTLAGDVEQAFLVLDPSEGGVIPMRRLGRIGPMDAWEATVRPPGTPALRYTFRLQDGSLNAMDPDSHSLDSAAAGFRTPQWAKDAVWYQVMVDRFHNGDPGNDPVRTMPWTHDWYKPYGDEGKDGQSFYRHYVFDRFAGGDLAGLRAKLPYLRSLGINALYLMPMFQASTPHKYNTTNYVHVDEHFGTRGDYAPAAAREDILDPSTWTFTPTDRLFLDFIRDAKSMGFRVVIDGVFNHCGTGHPAFQDVKRNGPSSRFAGWFDVTSWDPFKYEAWWGFSELPVFRKDPEKGIASDEVRKHIHDITRRWMDPDGDGDPSDGIDGWRLDVPNEVPLPFWHEWCAEVRRINPDAFLVGEIWERADQWLDGRAFDAVMNYEFAKPAIAWAIDRENRIAVSELDRRLAELRLAYPAECGYAMMNLLDSHDTDRIASMARNPDRQYNHRNREQDGDPYDPSRPGPADYARQRLLVLLQMTYVGAPMIYYGDEVGMWGSNDPNNRKPMLWDDLGPWQDPACVPEPGMLDFYRRAIALRRGHASLRSGSFRTVRCMDAERTWVFMRELAGEQVLVALNAGDAPATLELPELGDGWDDAWGTAGIADDGLRRATVPPVGGRVWVRRAK
jgi:cyclomaltodextrinase